MCLMPSGADSILLAGLMLIIGLRMVDMIPNGRWTSLPLFLAGALHSCSWAMAHARVANAHEATQMRSSHWITTGASISPATTVNSRRTSR